MRIALVTSHSVPFALGGAENLWWGLQNHIEQNTEHSCEIVSLLVTENTLDGLVRSYRSFAQLDLSVYDIVISGKYPAWMVRHPNHVCYMLHRLRGLYDTYAGPGPDVLEGRARNLALWLDEQNAPRHGADDAVLAEFFDRYERLRDGAGEASAPAFPGPLARSVVHFLDGVALSPQRIRKHAAIARTVTNRRGYFPPGCPVKVLYPPPHRDDYRTGDQAHFFTSSRLDGPKRIGLLIEAMKRAKVSTPLLVAGTGPEEARLRELAGDDPRIRFLGFVPDDAMPAYYADALAVPFIPQDEDYGLVTIEAMRSAKPVLTVRDAGGPTEFVTDGETGFVVAPKAEALAERLEWFEQNREAAAEMGRRARARVEPVTWSHVFDGLMAQNTRLPAQAIRRRPKLTVAATFPIYPPTGGGQARVFNLYRSMSSQYDIDIVSLTDQPVAVTETEIAPGMIEIRVPKSPEHRAAEARLGASVDYRPIGDIASTLLAHLTPAFDEKLELSAETSAALVACHPFLYRAIKTHARDKPVWFEAQDVELDLKRAILPDTDAGQRLTATVEAIEREAWRNSARVFACSQADLLRLRALYGPTLAWRHVVPNGVATDRIRYVDPAVRRDLQARVGLDRQPLALFMGSWHGPNLTAVEAILDAAPRVPSMRFAIIGSICRPFAERALPANVELLGLVSDRVRDDLLATANVALNPMVTGSGTNLKMLDYLAAGVPVVSTAFGARGIAIKAERDYLLAEESDLAGAITRFLGEDASATDARVRAGHAVVAEDYDWHMIAARFLDEIAAGRAHRQVA